VNLRGFNGLADKRDERIRTIRELADKYLGEYKLRHKAVTFAEYALGNVKRHLGEQMAIEVAEKTVRDYQSTRLRENAAPKSINEEVGFLLRLLGDPSDAIRGRLRLQKTLKLATGKQVGKAYNSEEKERLLAAAKAARSPVIYPALMLALHAGMRDAEIRTMQWKRLGLFNPKPYVTVGDSKTEAGEGRTIPLNSELLAAMTDYSKRYTKRFGMIQSNWVRVRLRETLAQRSDSSLVSLKTSWEERQKESEG
jgi:integrase